MRRGDIREGESLPLGGRTGRARGRGLVQREREKRERCATSEVGVWGYLWRRELGLGSG